MSQRAGHFPFAFNYVVGKMHRYFVTVLVFCVPTILTGTPCLKLTVRVCLCSRRSWESIAHEEDLYFLSFYGEGTILESFFSFDVTSFILERLSERNLPGVHVSVSNSMGDWTLTPRPFLFQSLPGSFHAICAIGSRENKKRKWKRERPEKGLEVT